MRLVAAVLFLLALAVSSACGSSPTPTVPPSPDPTATPDPTSTPAPQTTPEGAATPALDPLFQYSAGFILIDRGEYEQALSRFNIVSRIYPDFTGAFYGRGIAYYHLERFDAAVREFNAALERDSTYSNAYYGLALVSQKEGDLEQARTHLDTAVQTDDENAEAYLLRGQILDELGLKNEAIFDLERALTLFEDPGDKRKVQELLDQVRGE